MLFLVILLTSFFYKVLGQIPIVECEDGTIEGLTRTTAKNVSYNSYEGIPYAKPPIGNQRFKDPKPAERLTGVYNAMQIKPVCVQPTSPTTINGSEDCLFLNIYVPNGEPPSTGFPVMVIIHGAVFNAGTSNYNHELFMEEGLIFVGISFRLGVLGFLCLHTPEVPGNAAMKDQSLALRWIKNKIKCFNGDPNSISIFGEGSGAISVQLQQISPMSRGLMNNIMSISGASLCENSIQHNPLEKAAQLADNLGLDINSNDFLQRLQAISAEDLLLAATTVQLDTTYSIQEVTFCPVVEKRHAGIESFITEMPVKYYRSGNYTQVPMIIGQTSKEFAFFAYVQFPAPIGTLITIPRVVIPNRWQKVLNYDGIENVYKYILYFFFCRTDVTDIDLTDIDQLESAINLFSDLYSLRGTQETVHEIVKTSTKPVYLYRFSFDGVLYAPIMTSLQIVGTSFISELIYLCPFENPRIGEYTPDGWTRRRLISFYDNMARKRNPVPRPYSNLVPTKWLPVTKTTLNYLAFDGDLTHSTNPDDHRMKFWRDTEKRVFRGDFNQPGVSCVTLHKHCK